MQRFDHGGHKPAGLVGSVLTIYYGEPLALGGYLKYAKGGKQKTNLDWYHLNGGEFLIEESLVLFHDVPFSRGEPVSVV